MVLPPVPKALWFGGSNSGMFRRFRTARSQTRSKGCDAPSQNPRSFVLESIDRHAAISGKFDTPRLFVKTGTVQSAGFSQAKESLEITQPELPDSSKVSIVWFARDARLEMHPARGTAAGEPQSRSKWCCAVSDCGVPNPHSIGILRETHRLRSVHRSTR